MQPLTIFAWALFRPSRWRAHVASLAPGLRPDFSLANLDRAALAQAGLRRLLRQIAAAGTLLTSAATIGTLWLGGVSSAHLWTAAAYGVGLGFTGTVITASGLSVIGAVWGGIFIAAAFGLACGVALDALGGAGALAAAVGALDGTTRVAGGLPAVLPPPPYVGAVVSVAIGLAGSFAAAVSPERASTAGRQTGAAVLGVLTCLVTHGCAVLTLLLVSTFTEGVAAAGLTFGALAAAAVVGVALLLGRHWRQAGRVGSLVGGALAAAVAATDVLEDPVLRLVAGGAATGIFYSALFVLAFTLAARLGGRWAGAVACAAGSGTAFTLFAVASGSGVPWSAIPLGLAGNAAGLLLPLWLPVVTYPFEMAANILLLRADAARPATAPSLLARHSAFWHERQWLPLRGLDDHLLLLVERDARLGAEAIERIATSRQRWAARAARIEIDARTLDACAGVAAIGRVGTRLATDGLDGPASATLRRFLQVADRTAVALAQGNQSDRDVHLAGIEKALDDLAQDLTRGGAPADRFLPIALRWRAAVRTERAALGERLAVGQEIRNPYVRGVPLSEEQDIFVGRAAVCGQIAHVLLNQPRPALLLYGQRRMGKTSLLNRLGRLLPAGVVPLFVDLQGVTRARGVDGLLFGIARSMAASAGRHRSLAIDPPAREALAQDPFVVFDLWLDALESALGDAAGLAVFDEFEALDAAFRVGRYDERDLLGMLRHVIQHRRRLTVLLAGSHTLDEIGRWATYLVNVQAIHLSYLADDEARQLVERPIAGFPLAYDEAAVRRVLALTRCHPNLVQLLCYHIVARKNAQSIDRRHTATVADVEAAVPDALTSGAMLFLDVAAQAGRPGAALLARMAAGGEDAVTPRESLAGDLDDQALAETLARLERRELVEETPRGYRFQIELVRRWFAEAGQGAA